MLATALVGVSLALLQLADRVFTQVTNDPDYFLFAYLVVTAVCSLVSLFTGVPLVFLFFSRYSLRLCWGAALFSAGACAVMVFAVVHALNPNGGIEQLLVIGGLALGYVGGSAAGLTYLRRSGWNLSTRARRAAVTSTL